MANNDQALARQVAIPKFEGTPPYYQAALNWLDGTKLYWKNNLDNISKDDLDGFLAFALKDAALFWFQNEKLMTRDLTDSWANFKRHFDTRWCHQRHARATLAHRINNLRMEPSETIYTYRSRCIEVAHLSTPDLPVPNGETDAAKQTRLTHCNIFHSHLSQWYFICGLPTVIRRHLVEKSFTTFTECIKAAEDVVCNLVDSGLYKDPSLVNRPNAPAPTPKDNLKTLSPYISSITDVQASVDGNCRTWPPKNPAISLIGVEQDVLDALASGANVSSNLVNEDIKQYFGVSAIGKSNNKPFSYPTRRPFRGRGGRRPNRGRGNSNRFSNSKDYTPNAKCSWCGIPNHTEKQCWAKQRSQKSSAQAVSAILPTIEEFPESLDWDFPN